MGTKSLRPGSALLTVCVPAPRASGPGAGSGFFLAHIFRQLSEEGPKYARGVGVEWVSASALG